MKLNIKIASIIALGLSSVACQTELDYYNAKSTDPVAEMTEADLILDGRTESSVIRMKSNMWWTAEVVYDAAEGEDWCQISPASGYGNVEITVTSTRNYKLSSDRTAKIIVKGDDKNTSFTKEFTVVQKASSPYIDISNIEGSVLEVPIVRSSSQIAIKSNSRWTATSNQDWCIVEADDFEAGERMLSLVCTTNSTGNVREAIVEITSTTDSKLKTTLKVSQSNIFAPTVINVEKTPATFKMTWEPIVGAANYQIIVKKINGETVSIDAGTATEFNLAEDPFFSEPQYAGHVALSVKTLSEDPTVFSISEEVESNSHFTSGKGTESDPFIIGDYESLQNITKANKVLAGASYKLTFTPSMSADFNPICTVADPFAGIFNGNGQTISDWKPTVYVDERNNYGFFGAVAEGAKVSNLKFNSCQIALTKGEGSISSDDNGIAFVAGMNYGQIDNITISGCSISTEAGTSPLYVGAIAGQSSGKITNCTTSGGRLSAAPDRNKTDEFNCGGIVGYNTGEGRVEGCVNGNEIIGMNYVGGIAGYNDGVVINCGNEGRITANYYFGGITGYVKSTGGSTCHIENCYNTGTLVMDEPANYGRGASYMGGITSRVHSKGDAIRGCYNSGEMIVGTTVSSSSMRIGGIVGHVNNTGTVTDCYFSGTATIAGKANFGGIVGEFADKATVISNCYSVGKVTKTDSGSGNINNAFGSVAKSCVITSCYALDNGGEGFAGGTTTKMGAECGHKSESEMKTQSTFIGWDFNNVWEMNGYPTLTHNPKK